ncbi:hypothetical protein FRB91_007732 [Serendipita sp. 411]|nr:hypothetical protein FRB91_007732 [Serendipita sp. 411]
MASGTSGMPTQPYATPRHIQLLNDNGSRATFSLGGEGTVRLERLLVVSWIIPCMDQQEEVAVWAVRD